MRVFQVTILMLFITEAAIAEIILDTPSGQVALPAIDGDTTIKQEMGTIDGNNLFHNFSSFNLDQNETAIFNGESGINNVINRVTGNDISVINGSVVSNIEGANFWFINPNGVLLGEHASFNIPGALNISTANALMFANGEKLTFKDLATTTDSKIVSLEFSSNNSAIVLDQPNINNSVQGDITISANIVNAYSAQLEASEGNINIISISSNEIPMKDSSIQVRIEDFNDINLIDSSIKGASNSESDVNISGEQVALINSQIDASGNISLEAIENINFSDSSLKTNASSGKIIVNSQNTIYVNENTVMLAVDIQGNNISEKVDIIGDIHQISDSAEGLVENNDKLIGTPELQVKELEFTDNQPESQQETYTFNADSNLHVSSGLNTTSNNLIKANQKNQNDSVNTKKTTALSELEQVKSACEMEGNGVSNAAYDYGDYFGQLDITSEIKNKVAVRFGVITCIN